uniref:Uncharacterized protein n=1 Tax=Tetranychus urticae TaxID=32264 RepID=T1KEN4_TETUR
MVDLLHTIYHLSLLLNLKMRASTSDGPLNKIPKAVEYVLSQMFPKQQEDNNTVTKTNNSVVHSPVADSTPSSHLPVPSNPTLSSLLSSPVSQNSYPLPVPPNTTLSSLLSSPVSQNCCTQVNSEQPKQNPEEDDDDICILETRIVSQQQKVVSNRQILTAYIDPDQLMTFISQMNPADVVQHENGSYNLVGESVERVKEFIYNQNKGLTSPSVSNTQKLWVLSVVNNKIQMQRAPSSSNSVPGTVTSNYTPSTAPRTYAQTPVIQNIANYKSQLVHPASTLSYPQPVKIENTTNQGPRAVVSTASQSVWTPVSHQNNIPQARVNYIPHPNAQMMIRTTIVTKPAQSQTPQHSQQSQIQRNQPVQYQTIQQSQHQAIQQHQPQNMQYQAQFQGVQQPQGQNIQIQHRLSLQRRPIILTGQVQLSGRSQTPVVQSINAPCNAPCNACPQLANSNIFNRSPSVPVVVNNPEYNNQEIRIHPSPPPPYHQHDQHYQQPQSPLTPSQQLQQQQQQLQQQQQQLQLQQQLQQQQQIQQQQQQCQQQPSHQLLQQQQLQQQHTYQQSVSGGVSSIVDHAFTTEFQYQQILKSNAFDGSYSKVSTHQGTVIPPNHSGQSLLVPTQNFTSQSAPVVQAPFSSNSNSHSNHMNQSQISMGTNNVNNCSPPANWSDNQAAKQNLPGEDDLQAIANFNSSTSFGETYWTPNIFPKDSTY